MKYHGGKKPIGNTVNCGTSGKRCSNFHYNLITAERSKAVEISIKNYMFNTTLLQYDRGLVMQFSSVENCVCLDECKSYFYINGIREYKCSNLSKLSRYLFPTAWHSEVRQEYWDRSKASFYSGTLCLCSSLPLYYTEFF